MWSAATRPAVIAASWFAGTGAPESCWVTNNRGGVTHRVHSQLTYPYTTRKRGPVIPFQGWRFPINARVGLASRCPSRLSAVRLSGWWVRVWVSPTSKPCLPQGAWAHVLGGGGGEGGPSGAPPVALAAHTPVAQGWCAERNNSYNSCYDRLDLDPAPPAAAPLRAPVVRRVTAEARAVDQDPSQAASVRRPFNAGTLC